MGLKEREEKRQSLINELINENISKQTQKNENTYIQRSYFITPEQSKKIGYEKLETGKTASEVIREAIDLYFNSK